MHTNSLERTSKISEKYFFNFYFLKVDIFLTMHDLNLKLQICVQDIVMEGTVSQIFSKIDSLFFMKFEVNVIHTHRKFYIFKCKIESDMDD